MWRHVDELPYALIAEASTPSDISVKSLFTLEKLGFKASVMEAIAAGATRANELAQSSD